MPLCRTLAVLFMCGQRSNAPPSAVDAALPYELRALEAALSTAARLLEAETSALEARALPSLHSLTQKVGARAYDWSHWFNRPMYLTLQHLHGCFERSEKNM